MADRAGAVDLYNFLLDHVESRLTKPVTRKQIIPGSNLAWDSPCGQLSLRAPEATVSSAGGSESSVPCFHEVRSTVYISVLRCVTALTKDNKTPSAQRVTFEGVDYVRDMHEVANALSCLELPPHLENIVHSIRLDRYTALGAEGGMAGGEWSLNIVWSGAWLP